MRSIQTDTEGNQNPLLKQEKSAGKRESKTQTQFAEKPQAQTEAYSQLLDKANVQKN